MTERHTHVLRGCTPSPLASYLKGLGLLRVLTACDPSLKAAWIGEHLQLDSAESAATLRAYLLDHYMPTPILAPWNGGSGFFEKDNKTAPQAILTSETPRFAAYRESLGVAEQSLRGMDRSASPKDQAKTQLLTRVRGLLPDVALDWFDAAILLAGDGAKFPPLLGTGGIDGRLDFTNNFMQRLLDLIDPSTGHATKKSSAWLDLAIFGCPAPGQDKFKIGQFSPSQVGGPNSSTGYTSEGRISPWDFILMLEGALAFAAAAVRRGDQGRGGVLSFPFTVRTTAAGNGAIGHTDWKDGKDGMTRGELWMPLWSHYASYNEIRSVFSEGRVALGTRPTRDALDFIRAIHRLGGYRGIDRFQRYNFLRRNGKAFLATPLERVQISTNPQSAWLDDLDQDGWLDSFRQFSRGANTARRFAVLRKQLEDALFELAGNDPTPARVQALLVLLGEIQFAIAHSAKAREVLRPIPRLSEAWVLHADDPDSPTFRIARALAGLRGEDGKPLPLRAQLFPVHPRINAWTETACTSKGAHNDLSCRVRLHTPTSGDLENDLIALLNRRLWLAERLAFKDKPLQSAAGIDLDDLDLFLRGRDIDRDIAALLPGLALCHIPFAPDRTAGKHRAAIGFALPALLMVSDATLRRRLDAGDEFHLPIPSGLIARLASNNPAQARRAMESAWRRLRASGLNPIGSARHPPELLGLSPRRVAAALLIPLTYGATSALLRAAIFPEASAAASHEPAQDDA
ncbi:MAG: type I-U CRISPR-associated protein Csx17 [Gammaproteobacteria bacterium]|nr:type I-U CRISPR-associated protein Csx17 [Gammaproteobacteria bacterium]MCP5135264.1 type I-U CRISPR-associated protein Csx17 [Gammaproteobacteria bacterium]